MVEIYSFWRYKILPTSIFILYTRVFLLQGMEKYEICLENLQTIRIYLFIHKNKDKKKTNT